MDFTSSFLWLKLKAFEEIKYKVMTFVSVVLFIHIAYFLIVDQDFQRVFIELLFQGF